LFTIETQKQLDEIRTKYETDKKIKENQLLKKENELKKETILRQNILGVAVTLFMLLAIGIAYIFFKGKQKERQTNIQLQQQKQKIEELADTLTTQNNKLIELDRFKEGMTGMIVHDLKNPINVISHLTHNNDIKEATHRMMNLVTNLLDISKFEEKKVILNKSDIQLATLAEQIIEQLHFLTIKKSISICPAIDNSLYASIDSSLIERVFENIIGNAIKFSPFMSSITIGSEWINDHVKISISNTGEQIPPDKKHLIFQPFGQATIANLEGIRSTGLGLNFCKFAIEAHGGIIDFESTPQQTTFWFTLPLAYKTENQAGIVAQNTNADNALHLQQSDIELLSVHYAQLSALKIYEVSTIYKYLKTIQASNQTEVKKWLQAVNNVVELGDEKSYNLLVELIHPNNCKVQS